MRILYIAYPLLRVSEDSAGGAEQVLISLERKMSESGHETIVAAAAGSVVAGTLLPTGAPASAADRFEERLHQHSAAILSWLRDHGSGVDLIHDMSGHFWPAAAATSVPVLATLHLPFDFYPASAWRDLPGNVTFNFVSDRQRAAFGWHHVAVVRNGVALERFRESATKDDFVLWVGRICEEKGPHTACEVALQADCNLVLAGSVYPFSYHQKFFQGELAPRIAAHPKQLRLVRDPRRDEVLDLLSRARALLVTSTAQETSSLVAMEALASGMPVIALDRGALREVVDHGQTGFIADTPQAMAGYLDEIDRIAPAACRQTARERFSAGRMAHDYRQLYETLIAQRRLALELAA